MKVRRFVWAAASGWRPIAGDGELGAAPDLVLYFGAREALEGTPALAALACMHPGAPLVGCSTGGEILGDEVLDGGVVAVAIRLEAGRVKVASRRIDSFPDSYVAGRSLGEGVLAEELRGVLVLSDGTSVNGSELVRGMRASLGDAVPISGGLAGDGARFERTLVGVDGRLEAGQMAAVGFVGASLRLGHGSGGGWSPFGPRRVITRSVGNVLYELDGRPALDLYKAYLGPEAERLPSSALLFPLMVTLPGAGRGPMVRTVLGVDEAGRSMAFAGDVPSGGSAQLMRASFDRLVEGAGAAAARTGATDGLAILISCIGRKLAMGQCISDEVEAVAEVLPPTVRTVGFYSYGEIAPHGETQLSELHNESMTITVLSEA